MTDKILPVLSLSLAAAGLALAAPADAQYRQRVTHDMSRCASGAGPSVMVTITEVASSRGTIRVQSYRGTREDWLERGRWINRIELPARSGTMRVCVPLPASGTYGIAVRHDVNGNGRSDLRTDGGAMSNNPSLNVFNLGKPSYRKTRFNAGSGVTRMSIRMRYM